jgi:hypothetical protein
MKIKNNIFAIAAAAPAITKNPKSAATIATMKKITAYRNIIAFSFYY